MLSSAATRQWLSPLVGALFAAIALTGILMLLDWRAPGVRGLHEAAGIAFAGAGLAHLVSNWRTLLTYFRKPKGWVTLVAGVLVCVALLLAGIADGGDHEYGPGRWDRDRHERRLGQPGTTGVG